MHIFTTHSFPISSKLRCYYLNSCWRYTDSRQRRVGCGMTRSQRNSELNEHGWLPEKAIRHDGLESRSLNLLCESSTGDQEPAPQCWTAHLSPINQPNSTRSNNQPTKPALATHRAITVYTLTRCWCPYETHQQRWAIGNWILGDLERFGDCICHHVSILSAIAYPALDFTIRQKTITLTISFFSLHHWKSYTMEGLTDQIVQNIQNAIGAR